MTTDNDLKLFEYRIKRTRLTPKHALCESLAVADPRAMARLCLERMPHDDREGFYVLSLAATKQVLGFSMVAVGGPWSVQVHPREAFRAAVMDGAEAIMVAHNHPSGNTTPSVEDDLMTAKLMAAGEILGIGLADHVVFCETDCYSYAADGWRRLNGKMLIQAMEGLL